MSAFFSSSFFGSDPGSIPTFSGQGDTNATIFVPGASSAPTSASSTGGDSSTDWLNTIFKFAQLGTQTYLAQDALNSSKPAVIYGPNGQPIASGGGAIAAGGLNSILGTSSIWLFLFLIVMVLLFLKK